MSKAEKVIQAYRDGVAAALREVVNQVLPYSPNDTFTAWKQEVLQIADEIEAQ